MLEFVGVFEGWCIVGSVGSIWCSSWSFFDGSFNGDVGYGDGFLRMFVI